MPDRVVLHHGEAAVEAPYVHDESALESMVREQEAVEALGEILNDALGFPDPTSYLLGALKANRIPGYGPTGASHGAGEVDDETFDRNRDASLTSAGYDLKDHWPEYGNEAIREAYRLGWDDRA